MIEFNKKDKNRDNIIVKITTVSGNVNLTMYSEVTKRFLFFKRTKLVEVYKSSKWIGHIGKWSHQDYNKWADDCLSLFNMQLLRKEERAITANKINKGKV